MKNLLSCIGKDLKVFGRSRFSAIFTVIVPLLIVLMIAAAFGSSSLNQVRITLYGDYTPVAEEVIKIFEEQNYLTERTNSSEDCIDSVKSGNSNICLTFSSSDLITFHVDDSRVNLAYQLINDARSKVAIKSTELETQIVNNLVGTLEEVKSSLPVYKEDVSSSITSTSEIKSDSSRALGAIPDMSPLSEQINEAKAMLEDLNISESEMDSLENHLNNILVQLNTLSADSANAKTEIQTIEEKSQTISESLNSLEQNMESLITQLNSLDLPSSEEIVSPIRTNIQYINVGTSNWNFVFPLLVALMIMFSSIILASVMVLKETKTKAYFRNFITPTADFTFLLGTYITSLLILIVQLVVLFSGMVIVTKFVFFPNVLTVLTSLLLSASVFIFIGLLLGYVFRSEETSILVAISIICLMIFFSNTIFPIESIAPHYQQFAIYNPFVVSSSMLKKSLLFHEGFAAILPEILILASALILLSIASFAARRLTKRFV